MKNINYLLDAFGFTNLQDCKHSVFGFINIEIIGIASILGYVKTLFGVDWVFFLAYIILILFEWFSGVKASLKKGEKHESRKLGRMIFKIGIYSLIVGVLNTFHSHAHFPVLFGYEIDPFVWLYWVTLFVIIWQLFISILENLEVLGFEWAKVLQRIINNKFYKQFDLQIKNNDGSSSE